MKPLTNTSKRLSTSKLRRWHKATPHPKDKRRTKTMARTKTRGWYTFEDGTQAWFNGLSAREKKNQIIKHGRIIRFIYTP